MSKENLRSIRFQKGASRIYNADPSRPYDLQNCEIKRNGFLSKLNTPSADPSLSNIAQGKPWIEFGGKSGGSAQMHDRTQSITDPINGTTLAEILSADKANDRFYMSVETSGGGASVDPNYLIYAAEPTWLGGSSDIELTPPMITGVGIAKRETSTNTTSACTDKFFVGYLLIPYNSRGEAGIWEFNGDALDIRSDGATLNLPYLLEVQIDATTDTSYVDVYRTVLMDNLGRSNPSTCVHTFADTELQSVEDGNWYYVGRVNMSPNVGGNKEGNFHDNNILLNTIQLETLKSAFTTDSTYDRYAALDKFEHPDLAGTGEAFYSSPLKRLNEPRSVFKRTTVATGEWKGVYANAMHFDAGVMMYGGAKIPTGSPQGNIVMAYDDTVNNVRVTLQFEYTDELGDAVYSDTYVVGNVTNLKVAWGGETALLVWTGAAASEILHERIEPSADGWYISNYVTNTGKKSTHLTFHYDLNKTPSPSLAFSPAASDFIDYSGTVFMSDTFQPWSITYDTFKVDGDETILEILPLRLAEEEGLRSYDFVVFTDKTVRVYKRDGRAVRLVEVVSPNLGVKKNSYTVNSVDSWTTLAVSTKYGPVFVGTNGRPYLISGRQMDPLDLDIPDMLGTSIRDIAYHDADDELWVVNGENEIWVFDFEDGGWNKNYTLAAAWDIYYLAYQFSNQQMVAWIDTVGTATIGDFNDYGFDEGGAALTAVATTQPMGEGGLETRMMLAEIDYLKSTFDATDLTTWLDVRHVIRNDDIEDAEATKGGAAIDLEFPVAPNKPFHPTLIGRGHQLRLSGFDELRDIELTLFRKD